MKDFRDNGFGIIDNPEDVELLKTDTINYTKAYIGSFRNLVPAEKLVWRKDPDPEYEKAFGAPADVLTLSEISEQCKKIYRARMITVFCEGPSKGYILQYGNHGNSWEKIGETCGYA